MGHSKNNILNMSGRHIVDKFGVKDFIIKSFDSIHPHTMW